MKTRLFGCSKFRRLSSDRMDRQLTAGQSRFLDRHRAVCDACAKAEVEAHDAMKMLRLAILEPDHDPGFGHRVLRRARVQAVRAKFGYWSPALFGAAIAGIAILAALQMIADSSRMPAIRVPGAYGPEMTRRDPVFPRLDREPASTRPMQ